MKIEKASCARRTSLSADDWVEAALDVMAASGLDAIAVESLARRLGVTKGSFYWHFPNREALLRAALVVWEKHETADVIGQVERSNTDARERIHALFRLIANTDPRSERLLLALSATDHPAARECVSRISERWRSYVHGCYLAMGIDDAEAWHWATFAYSTFIGTVRLRRDNPDALPPGPQFNEYLRFLIRSLIPAIRN